jgi:hypothetical protein
MPTETLEKPKTEAAPERKQAEPLAERQFFLGESRQNVWCAYINDEVSIVDVLDRKFWAHVAAKLTCPAKIVCIWEKKNRYAELIVFGSYGTWADVRLLTKLEIGENAPLQRAEDDYLIEDGGMIRGHQVIRKSDGKVIKGDGKLKSREEAAVWLRDWLNAQKAR